MRPESREAWIQVLRLLRLGALSKKRWRPFMQKYHTASEPHPVRREEVLFKIAQDIGRVSDVQGILALVFSETLAAAIIYALVKQQAQRR